MKIGIYSPYLDTFGGGERYVLSIAETLSDKNTVQILVDDHLRTLFPHKLKDDLAKYFDLNLEKVEMKDAPLGKQDNVLKKLVFFKSYDLIFYATDGSFFYSTAKRNILHIQSPLSGQSKKNLWNKIKLSRWNLIVYNSNFTKKHAEGNWPVKSVVIYPPVDVSKITPLKKKKNILSVGRFFGFMKSKKQEEMIDTFKDLFKNKKINDWRLHLVGSTSEGDEQYLEDLKIRAKGFPVYFYPNLPFQDLVKQYGEASIYWHAAGYQEEDPTKMEHFGITTVEAMAAGAVPVVINKGGQPEIIDQNSNGFLWDDLDQLKSYTMGLINDPKKMKDFSKKAIDKSSLFSKETFSQKIEQIAYDN